MIVLDVNGTHDFQVWKCRIGMFSEDPAHKQQYKSVIDKQTVLLLSALVRQVL